MKSQSWRQHLMKKFTPRQNKLAQTQQIRPFRQRARTHLTKFDANNNNSLHLYRRNESILSFILLWLALKFHWRTWVLKHDANTSEIPTPIIDLHFLVKGIFFLENVFPSSFRTISKIYDVQFILACHELYNNNIINNFICVNFILELVANWIRCNIFVLIFHLSF